MSANSLAQTYYERLREANKRIFELALELAERDRAPVVRSSSSEESGSTDSIRRSLAEAQGHAAQAAAQVKLKDKELQKQRQKIVDQEEKISDLEEELREERAVTARLEKSLRDDAPSLSQLFTSSPKAAPTDNKGVAASGTTSKRDRSKMNDCYDSDDEEQPRPKRELVEVIYLDDDDDEVQQDFKPEPPLDQSAPPIPPFDVEICMEPMRTMGTKTCEKYQLPIDLLEKLFKVEERYYSRYNILGKSHGAPGRGWGPLSQPACLQAKLKKESTEWRDGGDQTVACRVCVRRSMPCVKWTPRGMFLLPLRRENRADVVADGEIVCSRWVK